MCDFYVSDVQQLQREGHAWAPHIRCFYSNATAYWRSAREPNEMTPWANKRMHTNRRKRCSFSTPGPMDAGFAASARSGGGR